VCWSVSSRYSRAHMSNGAHPRTWPHADPHATVPVVTSGKTIRALARISQDRESNQQIDQARYLITRWAEYKHPGLPIEWYADRGVSGGKPLAQRPEGGRLLREIQRGDILVTTKIDRLARNVRDLLDTVRYCEDNGITLVITEQDIDTSGAYGRFMLTLLGALAELEREIVSERVRAAQAQMIRDGRHGRGNLPYGFTSVLRSDGRGKVARPHPQHAPRLRGAILAVLEGQGQDAQAEALGLDRTTFSRLLRNPRLYGRSPERGAHVDPEAAIISMSEWKQLQERLRAPRPWSRAPGYGAAMACYRCENRLYLNTAIGNYRCEGGHPGVPTIMREAADEYIEDWFLSRYGDAPMETAVRMGGEDHRAEELAGVEVELEETTQLMLEPGADIAKLAQRVTELHAERERIEAQAPDVEWVRMRTGETVGQHWGRAPDEKRTYMLRNVVTFVLQPGKRGVALPAGKRIQAIPHEPDSTGG